MKKLKRHKGASKRFGSKSAESEAEVFVLPPNLLQKLGIDLGTVKSTEECQADAIIPTGTPVNKDDHLPETDITTPALESSNSLHTDTSPDLETANFTEKPVFLSSIFKPVTVCRPEKLELSSNQEFKESKTVSPSCGNNQKLHIVHTPIISPPTDNDIVDRDDKTERNTISVHSDVQNIPKEMNIGNMLSRKQPDSHLAIASMRQDVINNDCDDNIVTANFETRKMLTEDHLDEAYSSDCSNSNQGSCYNTNTILYIPEINSKTCYESNKINILSEEILNLSQLNDLKRNYYPKISNLVPVAINTMIPSSTAGSNFNVNSSLCDKFLNHNMLKGPSINGNGTIVIYNDQGNIVQSKHVMDDIKVTSILPLHDSMERTDPDIKNDNEFNLKANIFEASNQETSNLKLDLNNSDNGFGVCLDIVVTDIEKHLEENEDILEKFAHEITSNDAEEILNKIEKSEKDYSIEEYDVQATNITTIISDKDKLQEFNRMNNSKIIDTLTTLNYKGEYIQNEVVHKDVDDDDDQKYSKFNMNPDTDRQVIVAVVNISDQDKYNSINGIHRPEEYTGDNALNDASNTLDEMGKIPNENDCSIAEYNEQMNPEAVLVNLDINPVDEIAAVHNINNQEKYISFHTAFNEIHTSNEHSIENAFIDASDTLDKIENNENSYSIAEDNEQKDPGTVNPGIDQVTQIATLLNISDQEKNFSLHTPLNEIQNFKEHSVEKVFIDLNETLSKIAKSEKDYSIAEYNGQIDPETVILNQDIGQGAKATLFSENYHFKRDSLLSELNEMKSPKIKYSMPNSFKSNAIANNSIVTATNLSDEIKQNNVTMQVLNRSSKIGISNNQNEVEGEILMVTEDSIQNKNDNRTSNCNEKIEEIATYLTQIYSGHLKLKKKFNPSAKFKKHSKNNTVKSKLCTHGVEKPGGTEKTPQSCRKLNTLKTYSKTKCQNMVQVSTSATIKDSINQARCATPEDLLKEINYDINFSNCDNIVNFCLCHDFGKLDYYERDSIYEHIHFWEQKHVSCHPNILFSMYGDDQYNVDFENSQHSEKKYEEEMETTGYNICWKNILNDDIVEDSTGQKEKSPVYELISQPLEDTTSVENVHCVDIENASEQLNYPVAIKHEILIAENSHANVITESANFIKSEVVDSNNVEEFGYEIVPTKYYCENSNQITQSDEADVTASLSAKKRKKCRKVTESDGEPRDKKTIKCGVCEQLLAEVEWDNHIADEHSYIAWRAGQFSNLEEVDLSIKLKRRLEVFGSLKCTFCNFEIKNVKTFIKHSKKCVNKAISNISNSIYSDATSDDDMSLSTLKNKLAKCGVCGETIESKNWIDHAAKEHDYLAWKDGEAALDIENHTHVRQHLSNILKIYGELTCSKCGLVRKYVKPYMNHVKNCQGKENPNDDSVVYASFDVSCIMDKSTPDCTESKSFVKCGVCAEQLKSENWYTHIQAAHDYLAWKDGDPSLDLNNSEEVRDHLYNISKECGGLICSNCGITRKYVKSYQHHVKTCNGTVDPGEQSVEYSFGDPPLTTLDKVEPSSLVKCGVCAKEVKSTNWYNHIRTDHNYLAWKAGDDALNLDNAEEVQNYMLEISKKIGGLRCAKCGLIRKYPKSYLQHVKSCEKQPVDLVDFDKTGGNLCAICSKPVDAKNWNSHKMKKHYNVAWLIGDIPIDIKNPYVVERYIKEYKDYYKKLVCHTCGTSRASCMGFYAHVLTCGKTEEETECFKNTCDICNKKYLCIYHNQHMTYHKEQGYAKERKLKEAEQREKNAEEMQTETTLGRRSAAEKARTVIEKYKDVNKELTCTDCDYLADNSAELSRHKCNKLAQHPNDSDASIKSESSDYESLSDIDSNISEDEQDQLPRRRHREYIPMSFKIPRIPLGAFATSNQSSYLLTSGEEYCQFHFSDENLYHDWRPCELEAVSDEQLPMYLPPLEESCNVKHSDGNWFTHQRFKARGCSMFVGASIQSIAWVPPRANDCDEPCTNYLAVAAHRGADCPRFEADDIRQHPALIQIWDYGDFKTLPKFVLGLAHDYGTVWAMSWCPSGVRDPDSTDPNDKPRLGLLAVACSDGFTYIFAVPYPSAATNSDNIFYKLKPLAQLRLSMGSDRKIYQATSLSWSPQRGHTLIVVGYGDGTTAYYDLSTDSPLLKTKENNITILYPYHDERSLNACVTGVDVYPSAAGGEGGAGAVCSASPRGAEAVMRPGVRPARLRSILAASAAAFAPLWPSALLAGEDALVGTAANELDWFGGARRLGATRALCGCVRCARVAVCRRPALRVLRAHPAYAEPKKHTVGTIEMIPLGKKRKPLADDGLATRLEPTTYEEVVKKYGIAFDRNKAVPPYNTKSEGDFPERFPLGEVTSMAFCPTATHHSQLAVATHAGVVFIVTV